MKELLKLLGLKAKATEDQIVAEVRKLHDGFESIAQLLGVPSDLDSIQAEIARLKALPKPAPTGGFDPAIVAAKMASGLSREQSLSALQAQAAHDATEPHDAVPVTAPVESQEATGESQKEIVLPDNAAAAAALAASTQEAPAA